MKILAHRGWWKTPDEKNSETAFRRAFERGYGIETDLRDHNGDVVVCHDIPVGSNLLTFDFLLKLYRETGATGTLALNIKADGLHDHVAMLLTQYKIDAAFVFDMSVPDSINYLRRGIPTYTRHSELEPLPAFYDAAAGVWMDCFENDWISANDIEQHRKCGKLIALVSPELHKRKYEYAWTEWASISGDDVAICTDHPDKAELFWLNQVGK